MIDGIKRINVTKRVDERGFFGELFRADNSEISETLVQFNMSYSYPSTIRAWHRHMRGQVDYFLCIHGCLKICAYDDREDSISNGELDEFIVRGDSLQIIRIPGILWHGFKVIGHEPAQLIYGVNNLYEYLNPDEERRPWDDPTLIPRSINGKTNDSRVNKQWDWNYPPHK
jgi:dTDP-4-dehydrorhamnose 3,5-epimerase